MDGNMVIVGLFCLVGFLLLFLIALFGLLKSYAIKHSKIVNSEVIGKRNLFSSRMLFLEEWIPEDNEPDSKRNFIMQVKFIIFWVVLCNFGGPFIRFTRERY